jgi:hypothetical protein
MAVVGPDTKCADEPNKAAKMGVTIAVYKPYSGGRPAMVAKAMPCGNTITAPVSPAIKSAFIVCRVINLNHLINGNIDVNVIYF